MATFGSYTLPIYNTNGDDAPSFSSWAEYSYSRTDNSYLSVTVTVYMKYTGSGGYVGSGTGASITANMSCGGVSGSGTIKAAGTNWSNIPKNTTYSASTTLTVPSSSAGATMTVSYSISNGGASWVTFATVPTQSTTFSAPALLWTAASIWGLSASVSDGGTGTSVSLSWSASNGTNNAITAYEVYWKAGTSVAYNNADGGKTVYSGSYTIDGLSRGTTYAFIVYALAPYGTAVSNITTASIVSISAPTVSTPSISRSYETVYISWSGNNGTYNPIQSYSLTVYNSSWDAVFSQNVGMATSYSLTVTRGTSYIAYVTAHGKYGDSSTPNSSWIEVPNTTAPIVSGVSLSRSDTTLNVSWSGSNGTDNPIQYYSLTIYDANWNATFSQSVGTATSYSLNVARGTSYIAYVTAVGKYNNSSAVSSSWVEVPVTTLPSIYGHKLTRSGTTLTATWNGADGQENPITSYHFSVYEDGVAILSANSGMNNYYVFEGTRGKTYSVNIQAVGQNSNSTIVNTGDLLVPEITAPTVELTVKRIGEKTIQMSWIGTNGIDNPITSYCVSTFITEGDLNTEAGETNMVVREDVGLATSYNFIGGRGNSYRVFVTTRSAEFDNQLAEASISIPELVSPVYAIDSIKVFMNSVETKFSYTYPEDVDDIDKGEITSIRAKIIKSSDNSEVESKQIYPPFNTISFYGLKYGSDYKLDFLIYYNGYPIAQTLKSDIITTPKLLGTYVRQNNTWVRSDVYVYQNGIYESNGLYVKQDGENEWQMFSNKKVEEVE